MNKILGSGLIALALIFGVIAASSTMANAQWRDRDYGYNNQQLQQGYQYGVSTGATDAQRGQSYSPERSRYYRDASSQMFRDGFVRGYDEGYRRYSDSRAGGYRNDGYYRNDDYRNGGYRNNGSYGGYSNRELADVDQRAGGQCRNLFGDRQQRVHLSLQRRGAPTGCAGHSSGR